MADLVVGTWWLMWDTGTWRDTGTWYLVAAVGHGYLKLGSNDEIQGLSILGGSSGKLGGAIKA